jgi:hypothetical protein
MDANRFPVDHAERDGAADNGSIAVIDDCPGAVDCCRAATCDHAGTDGSTGCFAA